MAVRTVFLAPPKLFIETAPSKNILELPHEILIKIFHLLPSTDVVRCCSVCLLWNQLIRLDPLLLKKIHIAWARAMIHRYCSEATIALLEVVKVEARFDPKGAKLSLNKLKKTALTKQINIFNFYTFINIYEAEINVNKEGSELTFKRLKDYFSNQWEDDRNRAEMDSLLRFLALEARINLKEAWTRAISIKQFDYQSEARLQVIKIEASTDPENAQKRARSLKEPYQSQALLAVVIAETHIDLEKSKETARSMDKNFYQMEAFLEVIKAEAAIDPEKARTTLEELKQITLDYLLNLSRNLNMKVLKIVKIELEIDPEGAKKTLEKIKAFFLNHSSVISHQSYKLWKVVKLEALVDLKKSKETTLKIKDNLFRFLAQVEVVKVEASIDPIEAQKTAESIDDIYYRFFALLELAQVEIAKNPEKARAILERIKTTPTSDFSKSIKMMSLKPGGKVSLKPSPNPPSTIKVKFDRAPHLQMELLVKAVGVEAILDLEASKTTIKQFLAHPKYASLAHLEEVQAAAKMGLEKAIETTQERLPNLSEDMRHLPIIKCIQCIAL